MNLEKQIFDDKSKLFDALRRDANSTLPNNCRFPARFIFFDNFTDYKDFVEYLTSIGVDILNVKTLLQEDDSWVSMGELKNAMEEKVDSTLILPFSELVRFYDTKSFQAIISTIMAIENSSSLLAKRRFYLPMIGIENRFIREFWDHFTRKEDGLSIWKLSSLNKDNHQITLIFPSGGFKPDLSNCNVEEISSSSEWFSYWLNRKESDKIVVTSHPLKFYFKNAKPDNIFLEEAPKNYKELIMSLYSIDIGIVYHDRDAKHWKKILEAIDPITFSFSKFVKNECHLTDFDPVRIAKGWLDGNDFQRWLLSNLLLSDKQFEDTYLWSIFKSNDSILSKESFLRELLFHIFTYSYTQKNIDDRKEIISKIWRDCENYNEDLLKFLDNLNDVNKAISLCTGYLRAEKKFLINAYKTGNVDSLSTLTEISAYLDEQRLYDIDGLTSEHNWIRDYIRTYRDCKIKDEISDALTNIILEKNASEETFFDWYHTFPSVNDCCAELSADKIIWVDALGIEWQPLLQYLLNQSQDFMVYNVVIGKVNLPTATEYNTYEGAYKIADLDELFHNHIYKHPDTLLNEIECIKHIAEKILSLCKKGKRLAVVSDHGATALSRLFPSCKYKANSSHEGRFSTPQELPKLADGDYVRFQKNVIALKHSSLETKPLREVHGGCTPEEVLVPIFLISDKQLKEQAIQVVLPKTEFEIEDKFLPILIKGSNLSPIITIAKTRVNSKFDGKYWQVPIPKGSTGETDVSVSIGDWNKQFRINIKSGYSETDLF